MYLGRLVFVCALTISAALFSPSSRASTIGVAVDGIGGSAIGNTLVSRPLLGGQDAIEYFIPLGDFGGVYGAGHTNGIGGFGQTSDSGNGGGTLQLYLEFSPVTTTKASVLTIHFEDLDLNGVSDPAGFLETIELFDKDGMSLTVTAITAIGGLITGNEYTQTLTLALGVLLSDTYFLRLDFGSSFTGYGYNTAEYLIAEITPVPLPAALPLFAGGLGLLGLMGWRRKRISAV